ncbi:MAG: DUF2029 domain-containing protein [Chloroflexota bacterium]|nr:DUF2029 domain-containing protein [Chloroflexota bacterium]
MAVRLAAFSRRARVGPLAGDGRWAVVIVLVGYVLFVTRTWNFPDYRGLPFVPLWLLFVVVGLAAWRWRTGRLGPIAAAVVVAVTAMLLTDVTSVWTQGFRDLEIYLKAGKGWLAGTAVYQATPLTAVPDDLSTYPFLYPPLTLPLFGALSLLGLPIAAGLWFGASLTALLAGLRWLGLAPRWWLLVLAWPPVVQGLWVGNVAVPLFAFFAVAPRIPVALAVLPVFKVYSALAGLWLLRPEHRRSLLAAVVGIALAGAITLPLVGIARWSEWLAGLETYQVSQGLVPNLYGFGLARSVPLAVLVAVAAVVLVLALWTRGRREQLARLGVATVTGSPSLFAHGFLVALPAMLRLDTAWFWLAFGLTACAPGLAWFGALAIIVVSWHVPAMRKGRLPDAWHPLDGADEAWPGALTASEPSTSVPSTNVPNER